MRLSPNFTLSEFTKSDTARKRDIANTPTPEHLVNIRIVAAYMEWVRSLFGAPVTITSGYRNPEINRIVGGVKNSDHALGWAVDFRVSNTPVFQVAERIRGSSIKFDQLILETSRNIVHLSFNPRMRRQVLTQKGGPGTPVQQGLVR